MSVNYRIIRTNQSDELAHHGILGQKWGIRRYQNKDGSLTPAGEKHYKVVGKDTDDRIGFKDDIRIKAGTAAYRIARNESDNRDIRYISYRNNDRQFYKGYWGGFLKSDKIYEQQYQTAKDLLIPSAKTRQKLLSDMFYDDAFIKTIYGERWTKNTKDDFMTKTARWSKEQKANYVAGYLGGNQELLSMYGKKVVDRGFNAVIDDGGRTVGEMPIIVFAANKNLQQTGANAVGALEQIMAREEYKKDKADAYKRQNAVI